DQPAEQVRRATDEVLLQRIRLIDAVGNQLREGAPAELGEEFDLLKRRHEVQVVLVLRGLVEEVLEDVDDADCMAHTGLEFGTFWDLLRERILGPGFVLAPLRLAETLKVLRLRFFVFSHEKSSPNSGDTVSDENNRVAVKSKELAGGAVG